MYVPPLLVFPRNNMKTELLDGPPPGSIAARHKAGWIRKESFTQRFKYFVRFVKMSKEDPVILTLDGRYAHYRSIEVLECARENEVHFVCLPQHSTHKLKPLGVSFMKPLKTYYAQKIKNLAEKASKQSCYTLSNYWTGWESLLELGNNSHCYNRFPENRLMSLKSSRI
jgi:hypothetical protein